MAEFKLFEALAEADDAEDETLEAAEPTLEEGLSTGPAKEEALEGTSEGAEI